MHVFLLFVCVFYRSQCIEFSESLYKWGCVGLNNDQKYYLYRYHDYNMSFIITEEKKIKRFRFLLGSVPKKHVNLVFGHHDLKV